MQEKLGGPGFVNDIQTFNLPGRPGQGQAPGRTEPQEGRQEAPGRACQSQEVPTSWGF